MEKDDNAKVGDLRFIETDEVEVFDGTTWRPYRGLPPGDLLTILRNDPEDGHVIRTADKNNRKHP